MTDQEFRDKLGARNGELRAQHFYELGAIDAFKQSANCAMKQATPMKAAIAIEAMLDELEGDKK